MWKCNQLKKASKDTLSLTDLIIIRKDLVMITEGLITIIRSKVGLLSFQYLFMCGVIDSPSV